MLKAVDVPSHFEDPICLGIGLLEAVVVRVVVGEVEAERFGLFFQLRGQFFDVATAPVVDFWSDRVRDWISDRCRLGCWADNWWANRRLDRRANGWSNDWRADWRANGWTNDRRADWRANRWSNDRRTDWWANRWSNDRKANGWTNRRTDDRRADRWVYDWRCRRNAAANRSNDVVDEVCIRSDFLVCVDAFVDVMENVAPTTCLSSCGECEGGDSGESQ